MRAARGAILCEPEQLLPLPFEPTVKPWLHQLRGYWFASALDGCMLAFYMGRGKTKTAIDIARGKRCRCILITCPTSVVDVWRRELRRHWPKCQIVTTRRGRTVLRRTQDAKQALAVARATGSPVAIIINHEAVWREPFGSWVKSKIRPFDMFIMDEAHRGKQHNGRLGKWISDIWQFIDNRLALTGTPYPHSQLDIFAQFRMLEPGIFGMSWTAFKERYAIEVEVEVEGADGEDTTFKKVVDVKNESELQENFSQIAYYVEDSTDLPEFIETFRHFPMDNKARKVYDKMEKDFLVELDQGKAIAQNVLVKLLRLQQMTSGYVRLNDGTDVFTGHEKIEVLKDLIKNDIELPIVVFCRFTEDLARIENLCQKMELRYGEVSGQRSSLTDEATMPEDVDVLGVQVQAGGLGIDLTRARFAVFYSRDYRWDVYHQCVKRLHRHGQTGTVTVIHLLAENTVDVQIYESLLKRGDLVNILLKGRDDGES